MKPAVRKANGYFIPFIRHNDGFNTRETVRANTGGNLVMYLKRQDAIDFAQSIINNRNTQNGNINYHNRGTPS